jgi:glyoxylase I family protein
VTHLGLRVARTRSDSPYTSFLADDTGRVIFEFYSNTAAIYPDYKSAHPLCFHIAFVADDPAAVGRSLEAAGATPPTRRPPRRLVPRHDKLTPGASRSSS